MIHPLFGLSKVNFGICVILLLFALPLRAQTIHYLPLGDSYTICEGMKEEDCWVSMLTRDLNNKGLKVTLLQNPSKTGYTTDDLIENELPLLNTYPDIEFVTLLIGVNDWIQGTDTTTFHMKLAVILDKIQFKLTKKNNLLLVTIPDFSAAPRGKSYSHGKSITQGISQFNEIIKAEAQARSLAVADIFPLTQKMEGKTELVSADGLHPSAKEYRLWEEILAPLAEKLLKEKP